ncbi:50S ribosomal protein L4 [Candidatus Roizmanbacteria bacterium RIFCSPHIGHO2_02_FULL_37_13b]|uniref:Large ribosomal subunit protein uL4 n=1 Tax=Candidatus Roizmanbacteria bacterium RIFCSPLOWO2_02_FULL_36_11 TaxID=1802071 RepID=A0A1F7JCM8_9BACT|nr:MAG: 50S ribosomal protein L4 [Candidatus Roizmanbacteria bacterium RIFCSPHIGHO2_02_FULL_37_13b]OGK53359.1 MAG: 50S ribosomal protein L4 [Candidatus Roizmanbacteria bacterium RIFCSPLOWO2_02_FULL_36_11]
MTADVYDIEGKKIEGITLDERIFNVIVSARLMAQYVRVYNDRTHQGTRETKTRADVIGSTVKIFRQKGTGRARHGSKKAPIFVGGGVAHGPHAKTDFLTINKKQKRLALYGALTAQFKKSKFLFVKGLREIEPKTKKMIEFFKKINLEKSNKLLIIYPIDKSKNIILSARNIEGISLMNVTNLNAMEVLKAKHILMCVEALDFFNKK